MDHPKHTPTSSPEPTPEDRSKDWGHGSNADRNGTPRKLPRSTGSSRLRHPDYGRTARRPEAQA